MANALQRKRCSQPLPNRLILPAAAMAVMASAAAQGFGQATPEFPAPPIVRRIEFFGLRSVSQSSVETILQDAGLRVGADLREFDPRPMTQQLEALADVRHARISPIYGNLLKHDTLGLVVYVGIAEEGTPDAEFREPPDGDVELPTDIMNAARLEEQAFANTVSNGNFAEDSSQGHSLSEDSELRAAQERYVDLANRHWDVLIDVLNNSRDRRHRAVAAKVVAYANDKQQAAAVLAPTLGDPDRMVRNNSTRALSLIYRYANSQPDLLIPAPPKLIDQLIDMLQSADWTDRNKATSLLLALDDDQYVAKALRDRAIPSLVEMARWQTNHGLMAFMLLAKLEGATHDQAQQQWEQGRQEKAIARMSDLAKPKSRNSPDS